MCDDFSDLDDFDSAPVRPSTHRAPNADALEVTGITDRSAGTIRKYPCRGCGGTGTITIYRRGGGWGQRGTVKKCWKGCGGTGFTATDPARLAKQRAARKAKKLERAEQQAADVRAWLESRPDIAAWFERHRDNQRWTFPRDLEEKLHQYGELTPGQLGAIEKCLARDAERRAKAVENDRAQGRVDLSGVPGGFYAVPDGETRLKVRIRPGKSGSRWEGWIFVDDGAAYGSRRNYGRQRPGGLYTGDIESALAEIARDPRAASVAYGKLVGKCGICNRHLEDAESVARGIGPVCAAKYGW